MIVKTNTGYNEQTALTANASSLPHGNAVPSDKISDREGHLAKSFENDNVYEDRHSMAQRNIQMRLVASLMFAFLPGLTQVPSLAKSAAPIVAEVPSNLQVPTATSLSPSFMNPDDVLGRRRTMDAARLTLEDYSGKRGKIPTSVKKQMDMQDRRLALCQEMSKDEWEWEQCFYYGTNNGGGGAMYFDGGMFLENDAVTKTAGNVGKQKIPTW